MYFRTDVDRIGEAGLRGYGIAPAAAVELGAAVLSIGAAVTQGGDFSCTSAPISYVHENTPTTQAFKSCRKEFLVAAFVPAPRNMWPLPTPGPKDANAITEDFWFALEFEYNGNDVREVKINPLFDKSSTLYKSKFNISFAPDKLSVPRDPVAAVRFTIAGSWEKWQLPLNTKVSFGGSLDVRADGFYAVRITSEKDWVSHRSISYPCPFVLPVIPAPPKVVPPKIPIPVTSQLQVFFSPPGSDRIVEADEDKIVKWFQALPSATRGKISAGTLPISIEGYASTTAGKPFNRELSRRRALKVQRILQDIAGSAAQFRVNAFGEYQAATADRVESPTERRVRITVTDITYR
jgi:outer membrane protein OmpA-like peptidoglycan-associated protein